LARLRKNSGFNLTEVADYPGAMPTLIEALEKEGVRFDESSFPDDNIVYLNKNVVILRGAALEVIDRVIERNKQRLARKRLLKLRSALRLCALHIVQACGKIVKAAHKGLTRHKISDRETCKAVNETRSVDGEHGRHGHALSRFAASLA
jgi:hypothetical protein